MNFSVTNWMKVQNYKNFKSLFLHPSGPQRDLAEKRVSPASPAGIKIFQPDFYPAIIKVGDQTQEKQKEGKNCRGERRPAEAGWKRGAYDDSLRYFSKGR